MTDDNVLQMPTPLERLAAKLKAYLAREASNRAEWIEIQIGICLTLAEAREEIKADIAFGEWCDSNGFGKNVINYDTRAAAIAMGEEPEALRKCLEETQRRSLHTIYQFDFGRFRNVSKPGFTDARKPTRRRARPAKAPFSDAARDAVRATVESGEAINRLRVAEELGVSEATVQRAVQRELGRLEGMEEAKVAPLEPGKMAPTMQQRYEATIRAAKKQIREELIAEVKAEVFREIEDGYLAHWRKNCAEADRILASHRGVISRRDYRLLLAALHPDHNTFEQAREVFEIFKKLESVLVKPDAPVFRGPPLPATVAELLARKAANAAARRKNPGKQP